MLGSLITVVLILGMSYAKADLPASSWDNAVEWAAIVALGLMGGNALTHIAEVFKKNGK